MSPLYLLIWLVPGIFVSIVIGGYIGYNFAIRRHSKIITEERAKTLTALQHVFESAEELSSDVDQHNSDLQSVGREVSVIAAQGDYESIKQTLLNQITDVIESNRRMEHDLVCTKYRLEEQAQELDRTRVEARTDQLSGVGNRKAFDEALQFMNSQLQRNDVNYGLLLIDVDHFKWINDTHGHQSGDEVVRRLGDTLKSSVRHKDHVARFGGDEFAVLFQKVNLEQADVMAKKIRDKVERTNFNVGINESRVAVTLSMGLAVATQEDDSESILQKADAALYRSKEAGRNRLTLFDEPNANSLMSACPRRIGFGTAVDDEFDITTATEPST